MDSEFACTYNRQQEVDVLHKNHAPQRTEDDLFISPLKTDSKSVFVERLWFLFNKKMYLVDSIV